MCYVTLVHAENKSEVVLHLLLEQLNNVHSAWITLILPRDMLSKVKCYVPFLYKKRFKQKYRQEFLKCTVLPAELERGTKALQFDVCCKVIGQNFGWGGTATQF